jgi:hypothetical protein
MWDQYGGALITVLILVGIIAVIVGVNKSSGKSP